MEIFVISDLYMKTNKQTNQNRKTLTWKKNRSQQRRSKSADLPKMWTSLFSSFINHQSTASVFDILTESERRNAELDFSFSPIQF